MREHDDLDRLIDSALARYAEPRPGMEQRMLACISGEASRLSLRRSWLLLAVTAPLAASLLVFAYFVPKHSHPPPRPVASTPAASLTVPAVTTPVSPQVPKSISGARRRFESRSVRVPANAIERPKLDMFPAPQPLSHAERLVTQFAREAPEADRKSLVAPQRDLADPIEITAIHIPALPSTEEDKN